MQSHLVYVGTHTQTYAQPGKSVGIYVFRQDPETGALVRLYAVQAVNPSFLAFDPGKRFLFAVGETKEYQGQESGSVASFLIDQQTGDLSFLSRQATHGGDPCHLSPDLTGRFLFVANHEHGSVAVLPIDADGRLRPATDVRQHEGCGPGPTQRRPHAHFVTMDPPGRHVLVNDKGIDKTMLYRLDAASGKLIMHDPPFARLHDGAAPRHLTFHPSGRYAYVNGEADLTITAFAYDAVRGELQELHYLSTVPAGAAGERFSSAHVLVEPSGRFLYVSNRGHDSIAIFEIDQETGRLAAIGHQPTQGSRPRHFAIDPSGTFLYAANHDNDTITHFHINGQTGRLTPTGDVTEVGAPVGIVFS